MHGGVEGLGVGLDLAPSILQHVAQIRMYVLTHILHRRLNGAIHQGNKVLLHYITRLVSASRCRTQDARMTIVLTS